jgi:hypothetical protein
VKQNKKTIRHSKNNTSFRAKTQKQTKKFINYLWQNELITTNICFGKNHFEEKLISPFDFSFKKSVHFCFLEKIK